MDNEIEKAIHNLYKLALVQNDFSFEYTKALIEDWHRIKNEIDQAFIKQLFKEIENEK